MDRPTRKPNRLKNYDYSAPGAYFLTICTHEKRCLLSRIPVGAGVLDGPRVQLTAAGQIVDETIRELNQHYAYITVDRYVIMPNHIHLLVQILEGGPSGTPAPTNEIIPWFVSTLKRLSNKRCGQSLWQRSYHDHVIRDEADHRRIAEYIETNPARWTEDCFYIFEP